MLLSPGDRCTAVLLAQAPAGRLELCMALCKASCIAMWLECTLSHLCKGIMLAFSTDNLIGDGRSMKCWLPMQVSLPSTAVLRLSTGVSTGVQWRHSDYLNKPGRWSVLAVRTDLLNLPVISIVGLSGLHVFAKLQLQSCRSKSTNNM